MKTKKIITILSIILIFSVLSGFAVYGSLEFNKEKHDKQVAEATSGMFAQRNTDQSKTVTFGGNSQTTLTYKKSVVDDPYNIEDVYSDEDDIEYSYNTAGQLVSYMNHSADDHLKENVYRDKKEINEEQAVKIADAHAKKYYGNVFEDFTFESSVRYSPGRYDEFYVTYSMYYGANSFITGPQLIMNITLDGNVQYSVFRGDDIYADFDATRIQNLTEETLTNWAVAEVKKQLGEQAFTYRIDKFDLVRDEGNDIVRVLLYAYDPAYTETEERIQIEYPEYDIPE
ncbi:MAG: hypothetical protein IJ043_00845 [Clostridia bacterium]|nr:hypothetical protein [Clostridia bacterium]